MLVIRRKWHDVALWWVLLMSQASSSAVGRQESVLAKRLAGLHTSPGDQGGISITEGNFTVGRNTPPDPFEWEEYGRQLEASNYREPYTRTFDFMRNLYECLAIEFHDAMFRGVDRWSRLPTRQWSCQFFPGPNPGEDLFYVISTPSRRSYLSEFALLHFLKGMEHFIVQFEGAGWVPSFDMTIDGFKEGRYNGSFQIINRKYPPLGTINADAFNDGFDPANGTLPGDPALNGGSESSDGTIAIRPNPNITFA